MAVSPVPTGTLDIPSTLGGYPVTSIGDRAFYGCGGLTSVTIPDSMETIGTGAFYGCTNNLSYVISDKTKKRVQRVNSVEIVSAQPRPADPTILDVVYRVNVQVPAFPVNVWVLAFKDGVRSFANVVRPETFVDGTSGSIGDGLIGQEVGPSYTEARLSWQVSADWAIDLAKVKFEVLATPGNWLPFEWITISATSNHAAKTFSRKAISQQQVLDALYYLYADGDAGLTLENGALKSGSTVLVVGNSLSNVQQAHSYVFAKMGYSSITAAELQSFDSNAYPRLGLGSSPVYPVKPAAEQ